MVSLCHSFTVRIVCRQQKHNGTMRQSITPQHNVAKALTYILHTISFDCFVMLAFCNQTGAVPQLHGTYCVQAAETQRHHALVHYTTPQ